MDGKRPAAGDENRASDQRETQVARENAADERQFRADQREAMADERERKANEREALADERERKADRREAEADRRQREADEREQDLDDRGQALDLAVDTLQQRTLETIERSRALLTVSADRLNRQEAAVGRAQARRGRHQAEAERASAESERDLAAWQPDPSKQPERAEALRKQAVAAIEAFAMTEEEIARIHEELAASRPSRRGEFQRTAEQARVTARRAREIVHSFTS